ncbi:hypothetical protein THAOC_32426, partial [Thalassiosira oceanica]
MPGNAEATSTYLDSDGIRTSTQVRFGRCEDFIAKLRRDRETEAGYQTEDRESDWSDSNPSQATRADWTGGAGDAATQQQPAAMIEDGIESTRNLALDGDEMNNGRVASPIDGTGGDCSFRTNGVRRKKRQKNPDNKSHGHLSVASKKFLFPAVLLLLVASFTSNLVVTAEEDRRHAANARGGDDENAGGPLERILQEEHKSSGLFDHSNRTSGLNEGLKGGAERQANGGGVDEAWL